MIVSGNPSFTFTCWLISFSFLEEGTRSCGHWQISISSRMSLLTQFGRRYVVQFSGCIIKCNSLISKRFLHVVHCNTCRCKIIPFSHIIPNCKMIRSLICITTSALIRFKIFIMPLCCSSPFLFIFCISLFLCLTFLDSTELNDSVYNIQFPY